MRGVGPAASLRCDVLCGALVEILGLGVPCRSGGQGNDVRELAGPEQAKAITAAVDQAEAAAKVAEAEIAKALGVGVHEGGVGVHQSESGVVRRAGERQHDGGQGPRVSGENRHMWRLARRRLIGSREIDPDHALPLDAGIGTAADLGEVHLLAFAQRGNLDAGAVHRSASRGSCKRWSRRRTGRNGAGCREFSIFGCGTANSDASGAQIVFGHQWRCWSPPVPTEQSEGLL